MPRIARSTVATRLLVVSAVGLFGCPQLLEDRFGTLNGTDGGLCQGTNCGFTHSGDSAGSAGTLGTGGVGGTTATAGSSGASSVGGQTSDGGASGSSGTAGTGGASSGSAGTTSTAGSGGTSGASGAAGTSGNAGTSAGSSGSAGTSGAGGTSGVDYSCWTLDLTSHTQDSTSNCIGIDGWNQISFEAPSSVTATYQDGNVCFTGSIATSGWGAVYNLTFNGDEGGAWDTTTLGVTGFELTYTGNSLPPSLQLIYTDANDDFCQVIVPSGAVSVPFASTHPNCDSSPGNTTPQLTTLSVLRLAFPPATGSSYPVDFCAKIQALP